MKILLIGEYSNVHATLAKGLRELGHQVTVFSNGDFWKDYQRDIDLVRIPGKIGGVRYMLKLITILPRLRGYDVVQLINPMFLELKAERIFPIYKWLRRHNRKMLMGAFGMDYYWVHECTTRKPLRYSDFNFGDKLRDDEVALRDVRDWEGTTKGKLNQYIANDCDGIISGLYEYDVCYRPNFPDKTTFIPYPVEVASPQPSPKGEGAESERPLRFFIGISKSRHKYKGTDIMLAALERLKADYPDKVEIVKAEGVPFSEYQEMLDGSDVLLDQLYSYTPAMNGLLALSKGIVLVGGGEEENYEILGENELRPIVNVLPDEEDVYQRLKALIMNPEDVARRKSDSIEYIRRHHDYIKVVKQYEKIYELSN